jgi:hypothetical protein
MDARRINEILDQLVVWEPQDRVDDKMHIRDREQTKRQLFKLGYGEDEIEQALDEAVHDSRMVVDGINVTIPRTIKSVKHEPKLCELGCGKIAVNQIISITYHTWPDKHWRKKCNFCQYYLLPDGTLARGSQQLKTILSKKKYDLDK